MPDWFYRTVSRPLLFTLPPLFARNFALEFMGTLVRLPLGPRLIDLLGHMRPDRRLERELFGRRLASPVGIGPFLDGRATALPALCRFGVGFIESGLVGDEASPAEPPVRRVDAEQGFLISDEVIPVLDTSSARKAFGELSSSGVAVIAHIAAPDVGNARRLVTELQPYAHAYVLRLQRHGSGFDLLRQAVEASGTPVLVGIVADEDPSVVEKLVADARTAGAAGVAILGSVASPSGGRIVGLPAYEASRRLLRQLRELWPSGVMLVSGVVHEPRQGLELVQEGASLVSVDTGLIFTGPGLPKMVNELLLAHGPVPSAAEPASGPSSDRPVEQSWFWTTLMGIGMLIGSVLALGIAATRIVLPYDEAFVGMTRQQLSTVNSRLLAFLAHDRVCLAGTMITVAVMQLGLSLFGGRRGIHFAQLSVFISSFIGFGTFFLFLGYGYFDPFHAFVTAVLFQLLLLGVHGRPVPVPLPESPLLRTDAAWLRAQWGQLLLLVHAAAITVAGLVICLVGATQVFVPQDLAFLETTSSALLAENAKILPLVAHDRATFGGMLVTSGVVLGLSVLWGIRPGTAWLWWTMLVAVVPAYIAAIGVHIAVGYTDVVHLAPAMAGLMLFLFGSMLLHGHMAGKRNGASEVWS
jgi:dihydroorotate dehydrogenase